jgi:hypothetical protein
MCVIGQVAELQLTVYIVQFIAIQLQLCYNHPISTIMQLHYNYSHNIMLSLVIFIHPIKLNMWQYEDFWIKLFFEILISIVYYDC